MGEDPGIVVTLTASMLIGGLALVIMPQPGGDIDEPLRGSCQWSTAANP